MEITADFDNIPKEIARRVGAASIVVAVAWFTDPDLVNVLCRQTGRRRKASTPIQRSSVGTVFSTVQGASRSPFQAATPCASGTPLCRGVPAPARQS
jgi:hypothetical protein